MPTRNLSVLAFRLGALSLLFSLGWAQEPLSLVPDKPLEREIAAGQTHSYKITLTTGQFVRVLVEQTGCDVALILVAPDGKVAVESKLNRPNGLESLSFEAQASGDYLLRLRPFRLTDNYPSPTAYQARLSTFTGAYRVRLETRATATAQDRQRIEAERYLAEAYRMGKQVSATPQQKEEKAQQALALFRALGDKYWEATTLSLIGTAHYAANNLDKAADWYAQALTIWRTMGDRVNEVRTLHDVGWAYNTGRNFAKAEECFRQSLTLAREYNDRADVANALCNLAGINEPQGLRQKAIEYLEQALPLCREVRDQQYEIHLLIRLGQAHADEGRIEQADELGRQAVTLAREIKDLSLETRVLFRLGARRFRLGQYDKAREYYEQALAVSRTTGNKRDEATSHQQIAQATASMGQYEKALAELEQSLILRQELRDRGGEAGALSDIGYTYVFLGRYEKALGNYEKALAVSRELKRRPTEGILLNNIGEIYLKQGQFEQARGYAEQAVAIARETRTKRLEAGFLQTLGEIYRQLRRFEQARACFEQALTGSRNLRDRQGEVYSLQSFGLLYADLEQRAQAQEYLTQALAITRQIKDRFTEGAALHQLMQVNKSLARPQLAVFYGKQSVNVWQAIRSDIRGLERESQQSFLKSREDTYRTLADLLIAQGRLPEAEQVIHLLKEEEYFEFIRRDQANSPQQGQAQLTSEEQALDKRYREIADQLAALGTERGALLEKQPRSPEEEQRLAKLEADLVVAGQAFQKFLDGLANELSKNADASARVFQLREAQGLMGDLRELGKGVVALYTLVGEDKYRVILTTADVQKAYEAPIKATDLNRKILEFRVVLQNPKLDPLPLAQELYKILVAPVAKDLKAAKAETLMWSLDGILRYVPVAALHDGEKYLVERFRNVVFTPASQARLKDLPSRNWKALGLGVTKSFGERIPALPGVAEEMRGIIRDESAGAKTGVLPGTIKLDERFTEEAMLAGLRARPPVVHVASHFQFQPGNETNSALLLGDGSFLSLAQIKTLPNVFAGVELLTLSACNTATGGSGANGKEVEGFGVLAQRQGAKAVVASLWPVADRSTKYLMQEFYRLREVSTSTTKAEALRQAQFKLLRGALRAEDKALAAREIVHEEDKTANVPQFKVDPKAPYAHPYYWAPFILIGNWK